MIVPYSGNDDSYSSLSALAETLPLLYANSIHITAERHLLVQHKIPSGIRRYELLDKDITDAILQYLHVLEGSPLLHTRQYTIDFIDCCLRIISK